MAQSLPRQDLVGRRRECDVIERLIADLRGGHSRALVIRADAGVGKSAILDWAAANANGCRVLRATGVESEMELPYAGLQGLCAALAEHVESLPPPQAEALMVAFGMQSGEAPDRFLVSLAVLSLLAASAESTPLLCLIDDSQWLDQASADVLTFVGRRLFAEAVGLVFAVREPVPDGFNGIEDLVVSRLSSTAARALLERVVTGPMDVEVRDRVIAESHGNPLALIELHQRVSPVELAGGYGLATLPTLAGRIENNFAARIAAFPPDTRLMLLVAAIEPVGDPILVMEAAKSLGLEADALIPALDAGLIEFGPSVRFRHPLVRSAASRLGPIEDRRAAHRALADATDPLADPDRRAWHRAEATIGFDEEVAGDLVRSADRARKRGGMAAAAVFHARAVELTPDLHMRSRRALMAAEDKFRAGAMSDALRLLDLANLRLLDEHQRARAALVRAHVVQNTNQGREAPALLLTAARDLEPHDRPAALATYADAFRAALSAGTLATDTQLHEVVDAIVADHATPPDPWSRAVDTGLRGLALLVMNGYPAAAPHLRSALRQLMAVSEDAPAEQAITNREPQRGLGGDLDAPDSAPRSLPLAIMISRILMDDKAHDRLSEKFVRLSRVDGAFSLLPLAASERGAILLLKGQIDSAEASFTDLRSIVTATSTPISMTLDWWIAAFRGDIAAKAALTREMYGQSIDRGEGRWMVAASLSDLIILNSLGRYSEALTVSMSSAGHPYDIGLAGWILPETIEAAVRVGDAQRAQASYARLSEITHASGTEWATGELALAGALLAGDDEAESLYREAVTRLTRTRVRIRLARAHLVFGEWLRRQNRRVDAREQLRAAHALFAGMGARALADRAGRELAATGEIVRKPESGEDGLTPQEVRVAVLAASGSTNPEIGAQLYLSPRTVEWHLRKVFAKLGVTSRRQLASAMQDATASIHSFSA